jgi:hypothetical protein
LQDARPWSTGLGGALPYAAVPMGGAAGWWATAGKGAAIGAGQGLEYGDKQTRISNAAQGALGGAAGGVVGKAAGNLIAPLRARMGGNGMSDEGLQAAQQMGYPLTPGQKYADPSMLHFEDMYAANPFAGRKMSEIAERQKDALAQQANKAIGQNGNRVGADNFAAADKMFKAEFEAMRAKGPVKFDAEYDMAMNSLLSELKNASPDLRMPELEKLVQARTNRNGFSARAENYMADVSMLRRQARAADGTKQHVLNQIADNLDGARARSFESPADAQKWVDLKTQYKDFLALTKGNAIKDGEVQLNATKEALRAQSPKSYKTGATQSQLEPIARLSEAMPRVPNSGTPQKLAQDLSLAALIRNTTNAGRGALHMSPAMDAMRRGGLLGLALPEKIAKPLGTRLLPLSPLSGGLLGIGGTNVLLGQ